MDIRAAGIVTDRLTPRQMKMWREIENVVLATDSSGIPVHPMLYSLWRRLETGGLTIRIELLEPKTASFYSGGHFAVEDISSGGASRTGVIRLYPKVIDGALTTEVARRSDGFLPFEKLSDRTLRYAEVLGHEMTHALQILSSEDQYRLTAELEQEAKQLSDTIRSCKEALLDESIRGRLKKLEFMRETIEKPARDAEVAVWRELAATQRAAGTKAAAVASLFSREKKEAQVEK